MLGSIHTLRALDVSDAVTTALNASRSHCSDDSDTSHIRVIVAILLQLAGSVLLELVFRRDLGALSLDSLHATRNAHNGVAHILSGAAELLTAVRGRPHLAGSQLIAMLICKPSTHHRLAILLLLVHHNVVLFDDSDALRRVALFLMTSMVLLSLDHVASQHLWVLYLNLGVVENVVVVVDVLYYFNGTLVLPFLFGFGRSLASLVSSIHLVY